MDNPEDGEIAVVMASEYKLRLDEYAAALATGGDRVEALFDLADDARRRLNDAHPTHAVSDDMHLTLAFSHAVGAEATVEAERIYNRMRTEDQKQVDVLDAAEPGSFKIWLRPKAGR